MQPIALQSSLCDRHEGSSADRTPSADLRKIPLMLKSPGEDITIVLMNVEPWLSGTRSDEDPVRAAVLYSFDHAIADIRKWTAGLTEEKLWAVRGDVGSVGFHIRHIAGSVDRLTTYAVGGQLSEQQMAELKNEAVPGQPLSELLTSLETTLKRAGQALLELGDIDYTTVREIGRKRVPVPLGVLLVHVAEHTQRHVGEVIVTTKLVRGTWQ